MGLSDVSDSSHIYIDANIFVYHFTGVSAECTSFLKRVAAGEVVGYIGIHTLAEVAHRLMIIEAQTKGLITGGNPARKLSKQRHLIRQLHTYRDDTTTVSRIVPHVLALTVDVFERSDQVRQQHGLLVNDSLIYTMLDLYGIPHLASADVGFAGLPNVRAYSPSDLS